VADIISIEEKRSLAQKREAAVARRRRAEVARKMLRQVHSRNRCEKCGSPFQDAPPAEAGVSGPRIPYRFCEGCGEEYRDFIQRLQGRGDPGCYWRNQAWMDLWQSWINYQNCLDQYVKTREFHHLIQELKLPPEGG
jgi:hypothetical protein